MDTALIVMSIVAGVFLIWAIYQIGYLSGRRDEADERDGYR